MGFAMCGIFGYYAFSLPLSRQQIIDLLFQGLKRLEYRGYDSAGISIGPDPAKFAAKSDATQPIIIKAKGNITALEAAAAEQIQQQLFDTTLVYKHHVGAFQQLIAATWHCRWQGKANRHSHFMT